MMAKLNPLIVPELSKSKVLSPATIAELSEYWDDLVELNELAYDITEPGSDADWLDASVFIHGVRLRSLSLGAYMWVDEKALKWFNDPARPFWSNVALAYAMSYSRSPSHLMRIRDKATCKSALKDWLRRCGCTYAELIEAIEQVLNSPQDASQNPESGRPSPASEYGPVIALLCAEYGQTPEYWAWQTSLNKIRGLCNEYTAKMRAQDAAAKGKSGHKPSSPAYIRACGMMRRKLRQFKQKVEANNG